MSGHSLGGSLAQLVSAETGTKAITYNAFGTGKILEQQGISKADQRLLNITNYGNPKDPVFMGNKDYQPGVSFITNTNLDTNKTYKYKQEETKLGELKDKVPRNNTHDIANMDSLDKAVKIEQGDNETSTTLLKAGISYDVPDTRTPSQKFSDMLREKYHNMTAERNKRVKSKSKSGKKGSASGSVDGKGITINGNHVLVEK